jgi:transglutaminase-like putative cysteine protease
MGQNAPLFLNLMKLYPFQVRHALAWFASAVTAFSAAAQTNHYSDPIWSLADTRKVLDAAAGITLAQYPDCDDATVEKKMMRLYRSDGTGERQDDTYTKVLTEKGRRNNRTLSLSFMIPYSTVQVVRLELFKTNGQIVPIDAAANSKESIDDSQMQMNIYDPHDRILRVNIPGVEVGDVIHSVSRETIERSFVPGQYAEETVLEEPGLILHSSYEVHAPADRPLLRVALRDEVPGTVSYSKETETGGGVVHHWEIHNVPRMFDEPDMPPYEMVLQRLYVSTMPDWQTVSKWYWDLSKSHLEATTPEMKQTVDSLTAADTTEMGRIKSVFYFVSKKVRYMGLTPEKDRPGFEPHDVEITFGKKYGVCRDKAALLVSMLREAGLDAYPVLISVGVKRDPEVPDPDFNHAIVSVQLKKGDYLLMDPTDENTRALLPAPDCDQSFLVCRPEGEGLKISPVQPPEDHLMRVVTTGTLSPDGALDAKSDLYFEGVNDDAYRNAFAHMKADDQRRFFERTLKRSMPGAQLHSFTLTPADMSDMSSALHARLEFSVDGMTAAGHGKAIVSLPWIGKDFGVVNFILNGAGLDKRKYPMQTMVACGMAEAISLKLAGGFGQAVSLPSYTPIDDPSLSCRQQVSAHDGLLDGSRQLTLKVVEFPPAQYATLKQTLKSLEYDQRKAPILAVPETASVPPPASAGEAALPPVQSNAEILESQKEVDVTDAHASTYKVSFSKRILTYAGKIRDSEIKVPFNPACETARLTRGVVVSKTGQRQEISSGEINVMDAGWNSSAKRYTGGKILVANLPGVEIGSTIEVAFEITGKELPFVSSFESFQLPDELDHKSFVLTAPAGLEIHRRLSGPAGLIKDEHSDEGGKQTFRWQAEHVQALPNEPQLPPEWVYNSGVSYFVGDLSSYLKELNDTMLNRSEQRAKAAALAAQLAGQTASVASSRLAVVAALRDFVAKTIRLAGPSFTELPLRELSAADTTLTDGYGHAADRAILLHAMLSAAGFQPQFVLASDLPPIAGITNVALAFPLPRSFEHPLVQVTVDGAAYYLNDTDQYAKLGSTSFDGRLGLVLSTQASEVIRAVPGCENKIETDYTLAPDDTGRTRVSVTRRYFGANYNEKSRYFSELPPEERRRYFQEIVSALAQGARAVGDLTTRFDTYPGLEQFTADVDNYSVLDGNYFYFDLPFTPSLFPAGADRRALPLFISRASDNAVRTEIDLPPGFHHVVMAPGSETLDAPDGSGTAKITSTDSAGKLVITDDFQTAPAIIPPPDYAAMLKVESALGRKSAKAFLLEKD